MSVVEGDISAPEVCYLKFLFQLKVRDKNYSNVKCQIVQRLTSWIIQKNDKVNGDGIW